jgi:hypothetical protein
MVLSLSLVTVIIPRTVNGESVSDTVTIAGGDTYEYVFNANSGDLDWEVLVYGDYFSGEYEHTGIYMEIYDNDEEENVYGLIDVEDNSDTVYLDSSGEYVFSLENENDFAVEVFYSLEYEELALPACCGGAMVASVLLVGAAMFLVVVLRKKRL